jgi:hypothetical protein
LRCKLERARQTTQAVHELIESYAEAQRALKNTARETSKAKKLWREGNKSNLIKIGMACIMFPDPSPIGEIIGAGFIVAGAVQKGIQNRAIYIGDINKNLQGTIKELNAMRCNIRI